MADAAHITVMLDEAVEGLAVRPDARIVDATFGRGGHARAVLERLGPGGMLIAVDRDPEAIATAHGQRLATRAELAAREERPQTATASARTSTYAGETQLCTLGCFQKVVRPHWPTRATMETVRVCCPFRPAS